MITQQMSSLKTVSLFIYSDILIKLCEQSVYSYRKFWLC